MNKRLTPEQVQAMSAEIDELTIQITELRNKRRAIKRRLDWYNYSSRYTSKQSYKEGVCYKYFGKRYRDLTEDERRYYGKLVARCRRHNITMEEAIQEEQKNDANTD